MPHHVVLLPDWVFRKCSGKLGLVNADLAATGLPVEMLDPRKTCKLRIINSVPPRKYYPRGGKLHNNAFVKNRKFP